MNLPNEVVQLVTSLDVNRVSVSTRDNRYKGIQPLRYAADVVRGDLKYFSVNICRLAVDAVAERMRVKRVEVKARGRDVSDLATDLWRGSHLDQLLHPLIVDALALGSAYLIVWPDEEGLPVATPESARHVAVSRHPVTREVTGAVKKWSVKAPNGLLSSEHIVHYTKTEIVKYRRTGDGGNWIIDDTISNPLGVVPVVPLINLNRIGDVAGWSVIDDMGHLVDALSKVLSDMIVASEDVARPRRWATGVDLEEGEEELDDGFNADAPETNVSRETSEVVSPFESGNRMFTVENEGAKFGQLPGADLKGYETAVNLLLQQIMSVSALPAHMMGVTSSNPASADAIRSAEASLTARAESRISVLGFYIEQAVSMMVAARLGLKVKEVSTVLHWASASTKSTAQEADAITKLHSLGIITTAEAREMMGIDKL